jgi:hypothetical protein
MVAQNHSGKDDQVLVRVLVVVVITVIYAPDEQV